MKNLKSFLKWKGVTEWSCLGDHNVMYGTKDTIGIISNVQSLFAAFAHC